MRPLVSLVNATYEYVGSRTKAFEPASINIVAGENLAVTGVEASGKSTLVAVVGGELPSLWGGTVTGTVSWGDGLWLGGDHTIPDIAKIGALLRSPRETMSGFLATVRDELMFDLAARHWTPAVAHRRVAQISDSFGISHLMERSPFALSGGERQRVALALSVIAQPRLVVLDDPEANLDSLARDSWLDAARESLRPEATIVFETRRPSAGPSASRREFTLAHHPAPATTTLAELPALKRPFESFRFSCLEVGYSPKSVIKKDFSLALSPGQCVGLVGPNGAGKTTMIRAIAGLMPHFTGTVEVDSEDLNRVAAYARTQHIAVAVQEPRDQFFRSTVARELAGGRPGGHARWKDAGLALSYARVAGVETLLDRHPRELSRSEGRRVGIASALALEAPILILDEPTVGLGEVGARVVARIVQRHCARGGGVIVASHDQDWLSTVAGTVLSV